MLEQQRDFNLNPLFTFPQFAHSLTVQSLKGEPHKESTKVAHTQREQAEYAIHHLKSITAEGLPQKFKRAILLPHVRLLFISKHHFFNNKKQGLRDL